MPQREHERASGAAARSDDEQVEVTGTHETGTLDDDIDAILDEIDDVLEENAEDFVKSFVQKGGQ